MQNEASRAQQLRIEPKCATAPFQTGMYKTESPVRSTAPWLTRRHRIGSTAKLYSLQVLWLSWLLLLRTALCQPCDSQCLADQQAALVEFFKNTNGPQWKVSTGWNSSADHCTWAGITCCYSGDQAAGLCSPLMLATKYHQTVLKVMFSHSCTVQASQARPMAS